MDLASIVNQAEDILLRKGSHPSTLIIEFEEKSVPIRSSFRSLPPTVEQKQELFYRRGKRLGIRYGHRKIRYIWLVTEAWMSFPRRGTPIVAPSLDPQRKEALLVLQLNVSSPGLPQTYEGRMMIRNREGTLVDLQPLKDFLPADEEIEITDVLLLAFLAGFVEVAAAYQNTDRLAQILGHILFQKLRMQHLFEGHS